MNANRACVQKQVLKAIIHVVCFLFALRKDISRHSGSGAFGVRQFLRVEGTQPISACSSHFVQTSGYKGRLVQSSGNGGGGTAPVAWLVSSVPLDKLFFLFFFFLTSPQMNDETPAQAAMCRTLRPSNGMCSLHWTAANFLQTSLVSTGFFNLRTQKHL